MGPSSPSERASRFPSRRVWLTLLGLLPLGLCAWVAGLAANLYAIPEVRPAFPTAQLISNQTTWDVRGFRTVRVYRIPQIEMRDVLEWYFDEDIIGRYGPHAVQPKTFDYVFVTPTPARSLSKWLLARYSQVSFVALKGDVEVTTETHFYWRTLN